MGFLVVHHDYNWRPAPRTANGEEVGNNAKLEHQQGSLLDIIVNSDVNHLDPRLLP